MNAVVERLVAAGLASAWVWACSPPGPPEESTRLRETLLAEAGREDGGQSLDLDPEREAKLRALGYLDD